MSLENDDLLNSLFLSSETSLIDILNQQTSQPSISTSIENCEQIDDQLSTLFLTTGRERNSTGPLKQWLYKHQHHPYPNEQDKIELMKETQMTASQITIWFTNARVKLRKEKKLIKTHKTKPKQEQKLDDHLDEIIILPNPSRQFVLAYSNLNKQQLINLYYFASLHPNEMVVSENVDAKTTHLIIGKEEEHLLCPLTKKLFESIARHLFIISNRWIDDCLDKNEILNEEFYEMRGDLPYGHFHDGMKKSRLLKHWKLFANCQFFLLSDHCQFYMTKDELIHLIKLCHGSILDTFPITTTTTTTDVGDSMITIVLCNEILCFDNSFENDLFNISRSNGVEFVNPEWLLESIVHFQLQPFHLYQENLSF